LSPEHVACLANEHEARVRSRGRARCHHAGGARSPVRRLARGPRSGAYDAAGLQPSRRYTRAGVRYALVLVVRANDIDVPIAIVRARASEASRSVQAIGTRSVCKPRFVVCRARETPGSNAGLCESHARSGTHVAISFSLDLDIGVHLARQHRSVVTLAQVGEARASPGGLVAMTFELKTRSRARGWVWLTGFGEARSTSCSASYDGPTSLARSISRPVPCSPFLRAWSASLSGRHESALSYSFSRSPMPHWPGVARPKKIETATFKSSVSRSGSPEELRLAKALADKEAQNA